MEFEEKDEWRDEANSSEAHFVEGWLSEKRKILKEKFVIPVRLVTVGSTFLKILE